MAIITKQKRELEKRNYKVLETRLGTFPSFYFQTVDSVQHRDVISLTSQHLRVYIVTLSSADELCLPSTFANKVLLQHSVGFGVGTMKTHIRYRDLKMKALFSDHLGRLPDRYLNCTPPQKKENCTTFLKDENSEQGETGGSLEKLQCYPIVFCIKQGSTYWRPLQPGHLASRFLLLSSRLRSESQSNKETNELVSCM